MSRMTFWIAIVAVSLLCFIAGAMSYAIYSRICLGPQTVADHWEVVNTFRDHIRNPANYTNDPALGLASTTLPPDPTSSLYALYDAEEIGHVDVVFPAVPVTNEVLAHWMHYAESSDAILEATGNWSYGEFKPQGEPRLHLKLWFRKSATEEVLEFLRELDEQFAEVE